MPAVAAVLIELENDPKKVLRVTVPLGISLQPGTRVIVDNGEPTSAPYVICFSNGCMADYEVSGEFIGKLKKGQGLVIQAINGAGQPVSLVVPLQGVATAYDGPPTDPKVFAAQQDELRIPWTTGWTRRYSENQFNNELRGLGDDMPVHARIERAGGSERRHVGAVHQPDIAGVPSLPCQRCRTCRRR